MRGTLTVKTKSHQQNQKGYVLLTLLLFMALLIIAAGTAASSLAFTIRRDREEELIHRGVQYTRAIREFTRKTGRFPVRLRNSTARKDAVSCVNITKTPSRDKTSNLSTWLMSSSAESTQFLALKQYRTRPQQTPRTTQPLPSNLINPALKLLIKTKAPPKVLLDRTCKPQVHPQLSSRSPVA